MKKSFILLLFSCFTISVLNAQIHRYRPSSEIGVLGGVSFYRGDLNAFSSLFSFMKPAGGVLFRRNFTPRLSLRANALYGQVEASDAKSNSLIQQQRNLSFRSKIIEGSLQLEFNYLDYKLGDDKYPATSYLFIGLGAFYFNPQANYGGSWVNLQPLGTEGQGTALSGQKKYSLIQPCIPAGMGTKVNLGGKASFGLEWGMRKTFTDYIDDVSKKYVDPVQLASYNGSTAAALSDRSSYATPISHTIDRQRGNSKNKDWYSFVCATLTFKISEMQDPCPTNY